jgi:polyphosphate kinase
MEAYTLNPIGHGHYAGKDGKLYTDLSTFTTALQIATEIKVVVR